MKSSSMNEASIAEKGTYGTITVHKIEFIPRRNRLPYGSIFFHTFRTIVILIFLGYAFVIIRVLWTLWRFHSCSDRGPERNDPSCLN